MEQQTGLEWLEAQLMELVSFNTVEMRELYRNKFKQAKQKDSVIIVDAYNAGFVAGQNFEASKKFDFADGIEYYLENFNSDHLENE